MQAIELKGNATVDFAHVYKADTYENTIAMGENEIEVSFLTEGELEIWDGTRTYVATKGDIMCSYGGAKRVKSKTFHCHHTARFCFSQIVGGEKGLLLPFLTKASAKTEEIERLLDALIYKPYLFLDSPTKSTYAALSVLCKIDEIFRAEGGENFKEGQVLSLRAKKYIYKRLNQPLTQREVARYLGVTPGYLCGQFKKAEGITLISYVNHAKLSGVKNLMEKEGLKLKEACLRFGYTDPNYVSHLYKKTFGRTITSKADRAKLRTEEER